jgi:hypothetical protein
MQVYKDSVLSDAESLEAKGVTEGDAVVLLPLVTLPKPPEDTTPVRPSTCTATGSSNSSNEQQQQQRSMLDRK